MSCQGWWSHTEKGLEADFLEEKALMFRNKYFLDYLMEENKEPFCDISIDTFFKKCHDFLKIGTEYFIKIYVLKSKCIV